MAASTAYLAGCSKKSESTSASASTSASTHASDAGSTLRRGKILGFLEWRAIEAASSRILPSDDGPGAREAEVTRFIDGQLMTPELAPLTGAIMGLARLLDAAGPKTFADRALADQDATLHALAEGSLRFSPTAQAFPQREAFRLLHTLTLEGFLSDPIHGGNEAMVGWKYIEFPTPTLRTAGATDAHDAHDHHHHLPIVPIAPGGK